ncbi:MAG TPA: ferric reductase-like transmembrane domain-containing protein [Gaiellaceae bacterium]|jgi:predicted ferric reductase
MTEMTSAQTTAEAALGGERSPSLAARIRSRRIRRGIGLTMLWAIVLGNAAAIVWMWAHGEGNLNLQPTADLFNSIGRITGLLGAYLALIEIVLLARLPWLERLAGFDRLTVWHRWNGHLCLWLILAHVVFQVWGYAMIDIPPKSFLDEFWFLLSGGFLPGMVTATVGTVLIIVVTWSSIVIVRRHLSYELWYAVHLTAYAGIALAYFHQIPTGLELVKSPGWATYWNSLYLVTLALVAWRVASPFWNAFWHRMRVADVVQEGPGVVSLRIVGRRLDRINVQAGQFFIWRFLSRRFWWAPLPFSLSEAPKGESLRITAKDLGNHSARMDRIKPGTRVVAEGPFGVFTDAFRTREKVLLVAGGIGITPVRALVEVMEGDVIVLYRVVSDEDLVFASELDELAATRGITVLPVIGDHRTPEGRELLSPAHLRELVPDVVEREVYLCGPPAMTEVLEGELRRAGVPRKHLHIERFAL